MVGDDSRIGANAVVLADVPSGATAVGVPARLVQRRARGIRRQVGRHERRRGQDLWSGREHEMAAGARPCLATGVVASFARLGIVVIGRNEGERLYRCLNAIIGRCPAVVYVDSGSTDGSVTLARSLGVEVVELDRSAPFSAARARNAGFERLRRLAPYGLFVQFVDGDCELDEAWLERGVRELESRDDLAVVCGRRRERFPDRSIYNRLADLEWDTPVGEAEACGGDAMMRVDAFEAVSGFDPTVTAGEEPELCGRLRRTGRVVLRVDAEMSRHDLGVTSFGPWWRRQIRSGYGSLDITRRGRGAGPFARQVRSVRIWTVGWLAATVVLGIAAASPQRAPRRLLGCQRLGRGPHRSGPAAGGEGPETGWGHSDGAGVWRVDNDR